MTGDVACDGIRKILLTAFSAAQYGIPPQPGFAQAIVSGDRGLTLDALGFDSLAWMEFCISVEMQSGLELTPGDLIDMRYMFEVEEWLGARI
jgi:acyl carrier protein